MPIGQTACESHAIALHGDVHVQVCIPQQEVTDQAADQIRRHTGSVGQPAYLLESLENFRRQATTH
jgi:hypothetical protein